MNIYYTEIEYASYNPNTITKHSFLVFFPKFLNNQAELTPIIIFFIIKKHQASMNPKYNLKQNKKIDFFSKKNLQV